MTDAQLKSRATKVLRPLKQWSVRCHEASLALIRAGIGNRVARGWCNGVLSQHSWVVVGDDYYANNAIIIDGTLWSYRKDVKGVFVGKASMYQHTPHGKGSIWEWGRPISEGGKTIRLKPKSKLSADARMFLEMIEPLDRSGWMRLASQAPVQGWPAGEIFAAMEDTKELECLVPIDRLGMLTDRNPGGLYLP